MSEREDKDELGLALKEMIAGGAFDHSEPFRITPELKKAISTESWDEALVLIRETYEGDDLTGMLNLVERMR